MWLKMTEKLPATVSDQNDFGLSDYDREVVDHLIWRKYRFAQVEADASPRRLLLEEVQRAVDPRITEKKMMTILRQPACKRYARHTKEHLRDLAMKRLKDAVPEAVDDLFWAREAAKNALDYREVRVGAEGHLDRVGATEKPPTTVAQVAVIQLHGRNYTPDDLMKAGPELLGEAVAAKPEEEGV